MPTLVRTLRTNPGVRRTNALRISRKFLVLRTKTSHVGSSAQMRSSRGAGASTGCERERRFACRELTRCGLSQHRPRAAQARPSPRQRPTPLQQNTPRLPRTADGRQLGPILFWKLNRFRFGSWTVFTEGVGIDKGAFSPVPGCRNERDRKAHRSRSQAHRHVERQIRQLPLALEVLGVEVRHAGTPKSSYDAVDSLPFRRALATMASKNEGLPEITKCWENPAKQRPAAAPLRHRHAATSRLTAQRPPGAFRGLPGGCRA